MGGGGAGLTVQGCYSDRRKERNVPATDVVCIGS